MKSTALIAIVISAFLALSAEAYARGSSSGGKSSLSGTGSNSSSHRVSGYTKKDGTYVAPHQQTNPNSTQQDNYSAKGNINPYTGTVGTKIPKK
jgi:heat shock protein HslJ